MGVYYVGLVENGIHGPELGYNGKIVATNSLGCVVIKSFADAQRLYSWAPVGTPVSIRR
jgi:lipoprotein-anchoring transpeptidase ErfK/SrfK